MVFLAVSGCSGGDDRHRVDPPDWQTLRARMVREQIGARGIVDEPLLAAMLAVPRHEFVPEDVREYAYADHPLPIGGGQTISQPYIVAWMTDLLQLSGDERVLEIGTGSGYQAAILSRLCKEVYSIEIDPQLAASSSQRLAALGHDNVRVRAGDGFYGWPEAAPFDGIIITAAAPRLPESLVEQLREGGRLVMPVGHGDRQELVSGVKKGGRVDLHRRGGVRFVPMTGMVEADEFR